MVKKISAVVIALLMTASIVFAADFNDFDNSHWAAASVNTLVSEGTIGGYPDGTFKPDGTVTRAEFVKMLGNGPTKFEKDFNDVPTDFWAYDFIMNSGLDGDADGNFNPNAAITRGDVLNLLWKRAGSSDGFTVPKIVSDQGENKAAIAWGYTNGIMIGNDGMTLRLFDTMTRAEGAVLIIRSREKNVTPKNFADNLSDELLRDVYNDSKLLLEVAYSDTYELTNGELARAASHLRTDEYDMSYFGLDQDLPYPMLDFSLPYTPDIYIIGRDVLGGDKITVEFMNAKATVQTAFAVLSHALAEKSNDTLQMTNKDNYYKEITAVPSEVENRALTFAYENDIMLEANKKISPDKTITVKDLMAIVLQLDHISGIFNKYLYVSGEHGVTQKVKIPANFDKDTLPKNQEFYQVIAKELPAKIYEEGFSYTAENNPKNNFDYSREFYFVFTNYFIALANKAKENGVDVRFTYYPALCHRNDKGYTIRVNVEVLNAKSGAKLSEIAQTEIDKTLTNGMIFFMDVDTYAIEMGFDLVIDKTIISRVIELY